MADDNHSTSQEGPKGPSGPTPEALRAAARARVHAVGDSIDALAARLDNEITRRNRLAVRIQIDQLELEKAESRIAKLRARLKSSQGDYETALRELNP